MQAKRQTAEKTHTPFQKPLTHGTQEASAASSSKAPNLVFLGRFYHFLRGQIWPSTLSAVGSAERVKNLVRKLELREDAMEEKIIVFHFLILPCVFLSL